MFLHRLNWSGNLLALPVVSVINEFMQNYSPGSKNMFS
jgi:hypothetical protein